MTQQEHKLMIGMITGLFQFSLTLFEILKTNGLATDDDLKPFSALVSEGRGDPVAQRVLDLYRQQAQSVGLHID